jgi:hypothetical protein
MSKVYNSSIHTHARVNIMGDGWSGLQEIVLHTGYRVWVKGSYSYRGHPDIIRIGDGLSNGFDESGNCLFSVPASLCDEYFDCVAEALKDAEQHEQGKAA